MGYTNHRLRIVADGKRGTVLESYLWSIAEGYRDFGFDDLTPLLKAQHEAKKGLDG